VSSYNQGFVFILIGFVVLVVLGLISYLRNMEKEERGKGNENV
jgi:hypothetical protein